MDGGRDPFFGFGNPFGGFGAHRSLMSSFFGGRDPFDDPFFTQPFGGLFESRIFGPNGSQFMGSRLAGFPGSGIFGPNGSQFMDSRPTGFLEQQQLPQHTASRGPIIEELDSDDETEEKEEKERTSKEGNPRKHGRLSGEPFVEDPDDETEG
nr:myeloid leukemia factor 1 isoform X1 [Ipomoea batatas]